MGEVLPRSTRSRIEFFEKRSSEWSANPEVIGLTKEDVAELHLLTQRVKQMEQRAEAARAESHRCTMELNASLQILMAKGRPMVAKIKAHAKAYGAAEIHRQSNIPLPQKPGPKRAPGRPEDLRLRPISLNELELTWHGNGERNVFFSVHRMTVGGESELIGTTGGRKFIVQIQPGDVDVALAVKAHRGELAGPQTPWQRIETNRKNAARI